MPTPLRNIRVDDGLWLEAKRIAQARGETLTGVIVAALRRYVQRNS